jgi:mono/diheme cytochrome c family protein
MRALAFSALLAAIAAMDVGAAPDAAEGKKLVAEKNCETCHHNKTLGDAKAVYLRKDRKVTSIEKLKAQVAMCNSELGLQLFPDEEEHIVAWLNQTYYKFAPAKP